MVTFSVNCTFKAEKKLQPRKNTAGRIPRTQVIKRICYMVMYFVYFFYFHKHSQKNLKSEVPWWSRCPVLSLLPPRYNLRSGTQPPLKKTVKLFSHLLKPHKCVLFFQLESLVFFQWDITLHFSYWKFYFKILKDHKTAFSQCTGHFNFNRKTVILNLIGHLKLGGRLCLLKLFMVLFWVSQHKHGMGVCTALLCALKNNTFYCFPLPNSLFQKHWYISSSQPFLW